MMDTGKRIIAIVSPESAVGFRLAGIEAITVEDDADGLAKILTGDRVDENVGILIVEERFIDEAARDILKRKVRKGIPVIIPIQMPERWQKVRRTEDYISNLIRSAIGYRLKIKV